MYTDVKRDVIQCVEPSLFFRVLINEFEKYDTKNIWGLYLNIERALLVYKERNIEPTTVSCQLEDDSILQFGLCDKGATLQRRYKDGDVVSIVDEKTLAKNEISLVQQLVQTQHCVIGHTLPNGFSKMLYSDLRIGDFISFTDAGSYYCDDIKTDEYGGRTVTLLKVVADCEDFSIAEIDFSHLPKYTFGISDREAVQAFYNKVKTQTTGSVIPRLCRDFDKSASHFVEQVKLRQKNSPDAVVNIQLGKNSVSLMGAGLWFDNKTKKQVDENKIKYAYGVLKTQPIRYTVIDNRAIPEFVKHCEEFSLHEKIEDALNKNEIALVVQIIESFCINKQEKVTVRINGFSDKDNGIDFAPFNYTFTEKNGHIRILKGKYDKSGHINAAEGFDECSIDEVIAQLLYKQRCERTAIKLKAAEEILKEAPGFVENPARFETIIDEIADTSSFVPIALEDLSEVSRDVANLIDSFFQDDRERKY